MDKIQFGELHIIIFIIDGQARDRDRGSSKSIHLYQKNIDVDILLNLDDGILKIGIVGKIDNNEYEYIFNGISKTNAFGGWVPHFNLYQNTNHKADTAECELRIVEIPPEFYGHQLKDNIFGK